MYDEKITILDFGSQYTQLIARRMREMSVFAEILPYNTPISDFYDETLNGIVLSGGPSSVMDEDAPRLDSEVFELGVPVLGICYGMQLMALEFGGELSRARVREYGRRDMHVEKANPLFDGIAKDSVVWMSHGDNVDSLPDGFMPIASTNNLPIAAMADTEHHYYALQFHPEVHHSEMGPVIIDNFLGICNAGRKWKAEDIAEASVREIREQVGDAKVIVAYSGGVDSTVMTALLYKAIGKNVIPIFVDNGLLRLNEAEQVQQQFLDTFGWELVFEDASFIFLDRLKGVIDPEKKRKIIGHTFIEVFESVAKRYNGASFLAQGTLYPDVIESISVKGPSASIKSHHNVGGLPERLNFGLIEPLRELFKDEVRRLGKALELPDKALGRHPFPGPGLAVRILGAITDERIEILQKADDIFIRKLHEYNIYDEIWQAFAVLLPVQTVGVMGDERTYDNACVLRAVASVDGMTADFSQIPFEILGECASEIINNVPGINRVAYDVSSKPPATIEWE